MRVLVVGGGHASLPLLANARELRPSGHEVTLISDCDRLWYSGMTPEYLGGVYTHADVTIDLGAICEREGVRFVPEPAVHLDPEARFVETASGSRIPYDVLATISNRIINEVRGVNRVVYDISSKPPATIEWE